MEKTNWNASSMLMEMNKKLVKDTWLHLVMCDKCWKVLAYQDNETEQVCNKCWAISTAYDLCDFLF